MYGSSRKIRARVYRLRIALQARFKENVSQKKMLKDIQSEYLTADTPTLFRTWKSLEIDVGHYRIIERIEKRNRTWNFRYFDDERALEYMKTNWKGHPIEEIYVRCKYPNVRADIWRYCILYQFGGGYLDIDSTVLKSLDYYLEDDKETVSYESIPLSKYLWDATFPTSNFLIENKLDVATKGINTDFAILNWCFFVQKEHPLLKIAIEEICHQAYFFQGKKFGNLKLAFLHFAGPPLFTTAVWKYAQQGNSVNTRGFDFQGTGIFKAVPSDGDYSRNIHYSMHNNDSIFD